MKYLLFTIIFCVSLNLHSQSFSVATFNVNYGNEYLSRKVRAITNSKADVIALQETTTQIEKAVLGKYPHVVFKGHDGKHPAERFGFLSKFPIKSSVFIKPKHGLFGTFVVIVTIDSVDVQFVNIHLDPARLKKREGVLQNLDALVKADEVHVKELKHIFKSLNKKLPTIILGDFNSISVSQAYKFLGENGFTDCVSILSEKPESMPTWRWRMKQGGNLVLGRIDYVFCDASFEPRAVKTDKDSGSDHFLLKVKLELKKVAGEAKEGK